MKPDFGVGLQHTVNVLKSLLARAAKGQAYISMMNEEHNGMERQVTLRIVVNDRYIGGGDYYWAPDEDPLPKRVIPPPRAIVTDHDVEELAKEIEEYIEND